MVKLERSASHGRLALPELIGTDCANAVEPTTNQHAHAPAIVKHFAIRVLGRQTAATRIPMECFFQSIVTRASSAGRLDFFYRVRLLSGFPAASRHVVPSQQWG